MRVNAADAAAASLEPLRSGLHLLAVRALGTTDAAEEAVALCPPEVAVSDSRTFCFSKAACTW